MVEDHGVEGRVTKLPLSVNIDMEKHENLFYVDRAKGRAFSRAVQLDKCMQLPANHLTFHFNGISTLMTREFFLGFFEPIIKQCKKEADFYKATNFICNEYMLDHIRCHVKGVYHGKPKYPR